MIISLVPFIKITFIHAIRSAFIIKYVQVKIFFVYLGRSIRFLPISGINCANITIVPIIYRDIKSLPRSVLQEISPYPT
jgi:hypothetical protein